MLTLEELKPLYDTLYERTGVPCCILDRERKLLFPSSSPIMPYLDMIDCLFAQDEYPVHALNIYRYLLASFHMDAMTVLVGPCCLLEQEGDENNRFNQPIARYVSSESVASFCKIVQFVYAFTTHTEIDAAAIPVDYIRESDILSDIENQRETNIDDRRMEHATHDSYQFELKFLDYVKRGRGDKIDWLLKQFGKTYQPDLQTNELETLKIKFISLTTLLTRLAIREGVPLDNAFSLSDALIGKLGAIRTTTDCIGYIRYAAHAFIDQIRETMTDCSPLTHQCIEYISSHLYERISLDDLTHATGKSKAYISTTFKCETGKTLTRYILEQKINEAERLLLFTDASAQDIATKLCFASQSHFIARFKEVVGQTPREFRKRNFYYL